MGQNKVNLRGAVGMNAKDWFDFFMHGLPFIYFIYKILKDIVNITINFMFKFMVLYFNKKVLL